ncbi:MAG: dolichol kinase [Desulfurococcales archaeon]|nr:dolichol kinase [Desulfurococcales archaeon]
MENVNPLGLALPDNPLKELIVASLLAVYVLAIVYTGRLLYAGFRRRGHPHNVAVYYVRKYIHMGAGGVVALLVPLLFSSPLLPTLMSFLLGGFLYYMRKYRRPMTWFQTEDNMYEVNFTIGWGASLALLWVLTGDPWLSVLPALFISFGDAVTGIVRNAVFKRRTKHYLGNIAMGAVVLPLGYIYAGPVGLVSATVATIAEKFESNPIDDNLLIALSSAATILLLSLL